MPDTIRLHNSEIVVDLQPSGSAPILAFEPCITIHHLEVDPEGFSLSIPEAVSLIKALTELMELAIYG